MSLVFSDPHRAGFQFPTDKNLSKMRIALGFHGRNRRKKHSLKWVADEDTDVIESFCFCAPTSIQRILSTQTASERVTALYNVALPFSPSFPSTLRPWAILQAIFVPYYVAVFAVVQEAQPWVLGPFNVRIVAKPRFLIVQSILSLQITGVLTDAAPCFDDDDFDEQTKKDAKTTDQQMQGAQKMSVPAASEPTVSTPDTSKEAEA
ncbi:uncharacterized protein ARMOST_14021 [Armillaria ostoyae]|uniref:Uncharacterized protein n=1 Tax=Armillaria ostoyae TaxID=47428 RepID=A0A284RPE5_ARMOS|nr:uncharacterized protein ARMOST_14021 [Armillaria ostoyae]